MDVLYGIVGIGEQAILSGDHKPWMKPYVLSMAGMAEKN